MSALSPVKQTKRQTQTQEQASALALLQQIEQERDYYHTCTYGEY